MNDVAVSDCKVYLKIAENFFKVGNYEECIAACDKVIEFGRWGTREEIAKAWILKGKVYVEREEFCQAFACYKTAVSTCSDDETAEIRDQLALKAAEEKKREGDAFFDNRNYNAALARYCFASQYLPFNWTYFSKKAATYFKLQKYEECIKDSECAIYYAPQCKASELEIATEMARIGYAYERLENAVDAMLWFQNSNDVYNILEVSEKIEQLKKDFEKRENEAIAQPNKWETQSTNGQTYFQNADYSRALKCFTLALNFHPNNFMLFFNRADCYFKLYRHQRAIEDCTRCIKINPKYMAAYFRKAEIFEDAMDYGLAMDVYKEILKEHPNDIRARFLCNVAFAKASPYSDILTSNTLALLFSYLTAGFSVFNVGGGNVEKKIDFDWSRKGKMIEQEEVIPIRKQSDARCFVFATLDAVNLFHYWVTGKIADVSSDFLYDTRFYKKDSAGGSVLQTFGVLKSGDFVSSREYGWFKRAMRFLIKPEKSIKVKREDFNHINIDHIAVEKKDVLTLLENGPLIAYILVDDNKFRACKTLDYEVERKSGYTNHVIIIVGRRSLDGSDSLILRHSYGTEIGTKGYSNLSFESLKRNPLGLWNDAMFTLSSNIHARKVLVGTKEEINNLLKEFQNEYPDKAEQFSQEYSDVRRIHADGNSLYRAVLIALTERVMNNKNEITALIELFQKWKSKLSKFDISREDVSLSHDFIETFFSTIQENYQDYDNVMDTLNKETISNYYVLFLRLITSCYIRENPAEFSHLTVSGNSFFYGRPNLSKYCKDKIEPMFKMCGLECIQALGKALETTVRIEFINDSVKSIPDDYPDRKIFLLYHNYQYIILYKKA